MSTKESRSLKGLVRKMGEELIDHARPQPPPVTLDFANLSDLANLPVPWLWPPYLPAGSLTVLDGDPGLGKSTLTCELAARLSQGGPLPLCNQTFAPRHTLLLSAEDNLANTIRPRLTAFGANLELIHPLLGTRVAGDEHPRGARAFNLTDHLELLDDALARWPGSLVVIDPLMAFMKGVDTNRDADVRCLLYQLRLLAERHQVAILLVRHLNKSSQTKALYRGGGSIGIIGAARVGLLFARHPDPNLPERRLLICVKNNLAPHGPTLELNLSSGRFEWLGESPLAADEILGSDVNQGRPVPDLQAAQEFLAEFLVRPTPALQLLNQALKLGYAERTVRRAKQLLGIPSVQTPEGWYWLPVGTSPAGFDPATERLRQGGRL